MSVTLNTERKSPVNTRRFAIAPLTSDTGAALTYGAVKEWDKALISVKNTPKQNSATQYASGQQIDGYVAKAGGTLDINVPALTAQDEVDLFGSTFDSTSNTLASNKDDVIPYVMVIWSTANSNGTINLHKCMKIKFQNGGDTVETSDDNGIKYQNVSLSGTYEPLIKTGDDIISIKGLDVSSAEGQAVETAWFAKALGGLNETKYPTT